MTSLWEHEASQPGGRGLISPGEMVHQLQPRHGAATGVSTSPQSRAPMLDPPHKSASLRSIIAGIAPIASPARRYHGGLEGVFFFFCFPRCPRLRKASHFLIGCPSQGVPCSSYSRFRIRLQKTDIETFPFPAEALQHSTTCTARERKNCGTVAPDR
ncbi:hypothetical protein DQ04_08651020 [Trypanosoma grayi]|uniref:hypothetical protein n=1 Tax=Trypanosoma grayi TaxID=71804 RepID=UPI0004F40DC7|nr:hypothetical protein DQ04_08651020 [Trypanosoma grayi]KEG07849.1 hypothetical protein DQ04_08651020 [Trypanosoma grayi]